MDLTRHEAEENMKHMQSLRKGRHDKPQRKTLCSHCDHDTHRPPKKQAKKYDTPKGATLRAMGGIENSPKNDEDELPTTPKTRFYPGQRILWHLRHKIPGPGKFKIRWARPYLIEHVYDNGSVDVTTLQGESLGRVNMNKLKPYQEHKTFCGLVTMVLRFVIL